MSVNWSHIDFALNMMGEHCDCSSEQRSWLYPPIGLNGMSPYLVDLQLASVLLFPASMNRPYRFARRTSRRFTSFTRTPSQ